MRWVADLTGRFPKRPHYATDELERVCDDVRNDFAHLRRVSAGGCLSVDDLAVMIECRAADLDLYADLAELGSDVEAVTDFAPDRRPRVRVSHVLSEDRRREHRLRTTLAHELAHVVLHNFIWWFDQGTLDTGRSWSLSPRCHTGRRVHAADWMEWQAAYASGALLMPAAAVERVVEESGGPRVAWLRSASGRERVRRVRQAFEVSTLAAHVRLVQLGALSERPALVRRAPVPRRLVRSVIR